jgi:hypothetical protein
MIYLRLFTVWTAFWFVVATLVAAYGSIVWGGEPIGASGSLFLGITLLAQPAVCGLIWLSYVLLRTSYATSASRSVSDWVRGQ